MDILQTELTANKNTNLDHFSASMFSSFYNYNFIVSPKVIWFAAIYTLKSQEIRLRQQLSKTLEHIVFSF